MAIAKRQAHDELVLVSFSYRSSSAGYQTVGER